MPYRAMTDEQVRAFVQSLHQAISSLQVALVRGSVEPAFGNELDRTQRQIRPIPGVPALPGPKAGVQELVKWAVPALGALRAEQTEAVGDLMKRFAADDVVCVMLD